MRRLGFSFDFFFFFFFDFPSFVIVVVFLFSAFLTRRARRLDDRNQIGGN